MQVIAQSKKCSSCKIHKDTSEFYPSKSRSSGLRPDCKECAKRAIAKYREEHPEKIAAKQKANNEKTRLRYKEDEAYRSLIRKRNNAAWHSLPPEVKKERGWKNSLITNYGMRPEDFNRLLDSQDHKCACCLRVPKKFVVDHCHDSGDIRGLLCSGCNSALGILGDDVDGLAKAMSYLLKYRNSKIVHNFSLVC